MFGAINAVDEARGVIIDGAGAIWVTGTVGASATTRSMAVWKLSPAGAFDPAFGGMPPSTTPGVFLTTVAAGTRESGWALVLDGARKLVVAGETVASGGFADLAIWRLQ